MLVGYHCVHLDTLESRQRPDRYCVFLLLFPFLGGDAFPVSSSPRTSFLGLRTLGTLGFRSSVRASLLADAVLLAAGLLALVGFDTVLESSLAFVREFPFAGFSLSALPLLVRRSFVVSFVKPSEGFFFAFEEDSCFFVFLLAAFTDCLVAEGFLVAVFVEVLALADDVFRVVKVFDSVSAAADDSHSLLSYSS